MEPPDTDIPLKPSVHPPVQIIEKLPTGTVRLTGIQFGLLSIKETNRISVIGRQTTELKEGITKWQDLFDARLGIPNKGQKCETCGGTRRGGCDSPSSCDGHFGHITLPIPIYHPHFVKKCRTLLSSICLGCSRVLEKKKRKNVLEAIFEDDRPNSGSGRPATKRKESTSIGGVRKRKRVDKHMNMPVLAQLINDLDPPSMKQEFMDSHRTNCDARLPQPPQCKEEPIEIAETSLPRGVPEAAPKANEPDFCKYCAGPAGGIGSKFPKLKLKVVGKLLGRRGRIDTLKLEVDEKAGVLPTGFWDFVNGHPTNFNDRTRTLLPAEALAILRRISRGDIVKLRMDDVVSRPEAFIMKEVLVTPNCNRLIMEDWSSTTHPKLLMRRSRQNSKLEALVKKVKQRKDGTSGKIEFSDAEQDSGDLQLLVARHFRACKVVEFKMKTGQEIEETGGSLELKWLKANVLAKRSNYSARTIISGDPCIMIGEIGVPKEIAERLTVEERVSTLNIRRWQKYIGEYMVSDKICMPGALLIKKRKGTQQRDLEVLREKIRGKNMQTFHLKLGLGDSVTRCLRDGDRVFANRPPSLHKHSLIALKVKVHPLSTFAINPLICPPFDADFDGDAFHIFVPQSLESTAELQELMSVTQQMICPQGGQPLIGLTQDSLVGAFLLTKAHAFINRVDMNQLNMWCSSKIPVPAILKSPCRSGPLWTGKQLFSMTLPKGLNFGNISWTGKELGKMEHVGLQYSLDGDVLIRDGEVLISEGGAKWLERSPNGIIRAICNHLGPLAAVEHLNCLQAVVHQWLLIYGFSVGLLDYHASLDANSRKRMVEGIQKSLHRANEASFKQALRLDRQLQYRIFSPQCHLATDSIDVEHHGCFGLLLGDGMSNQRVTALQGAAVERFQSLNPIIENLMAGYMDKNNSLLAMVCSGSKGSVSKITQQTGCLGLQLYKGEKLLPLRSTNKLLYFETNMERRKSEVFFQTVTPGSQVGYWESRGIIASSYLDGLNPLEFFIDSVASRYNVLRQGIEEPNQILKNLMLFMRDMHIAYDGTVRNRSGKHIIQFQYGGIREFLNVKDASERSSCCHEDPAEIWADSKLAGEPVGALAATAIAEPAYNVKMQSIHQAQLLGTGPVQLLKETLLSRSKTKLKLNDRRSILRLASGFGKERRALEIQRELQKFTLEMLTLTTAIEFWKLDNKVYVKTQNEKDRMSPKIFTRISPWMGHLLLCKRSVEKNKLNIHSIVELLNQKHSGKTADDSHDIYFSYSDHCLSKVHPSESRGMCIWFFPLVSPENVTAGTKEVYREKMALLLELMKNIMLPAVLNTTIKGSDDIERVRIVWEDGGSASGIPYGGSMGQSSRSTKSNPGELVLEVIVRARKGAGKRGAPWRAVKEACIPVIHLIDWGRSCPYSVQEIYQCYGLEAAHQNIVKRLMLATKSMGKPVVREHLVLVADTITHAGEVIGLGAAGYREFCHNLSISTPFTEAAFQEPKKTFLDAATKGAFDNMDGVLPSAVWGSRIPLGTGIDFKLMSKVPRVKGQTWPSDPLKLWGQQRVPVVLGKKRSVLVPRKDSCFEWHVNRITTCQDVSNCENCKAKNCVTTPSLCSFSMPVNERHESLEEDSVTGKEGIAPTVSKNRGDCTTSLEPTQEGDMCGQQIGCKRSVDSLEGENDISDERVSKLKKQLVSFETFSVGGDSVVLRVNDPCRVAWSIVGHPDDAVFGRQRTILQDEDRDISCRSTPHSQVVVSLENPSLKGALETGHRCTSSSQSPSGNSAGKVMDTVYSVKCSGASKEDTRPSNTRRAWSSNKVFKKFLNFFSSSSWNLDSRDESTKTELLAKNRLAGWNAEEDEYFSQAVGKPLSEELDRRNVYFTPINGSIDPGQSEVDKVVEQGIIDEKKELQNLLHVRYRVGERVQGDVEKMLLEEVLVYHPKRAEKVGCGVDYLKVDYHPEHPTSKCFHIVRKDGSSSDFSYNKCLDMKLLELYGLKQT